jgi:hypothetical protein
VIAAAGHRGDGSGNEAVSACSVVRSNSRCAEASPTSQMAVRFGQGVDVLVDETKCVGYPQWQPDRGLRSARRHRRAGAVLLRRGASISGSVQARTQVAGGVYDTPRIVQSNHYVQTWRLHTTLQPLVPPDLLTRLHPVTAS